MNIDELHLLIGYLREDLNIFIKNDFCHLRDKVDNLLWVFITGLLAIMGGLIVLLVK